MDRPVIRGSQRGNHLQRMVVRRRGCRQSNGLCTCAKRDPDPEHRAGGHSNGQRRHPDLLGHHPTGPRHSYRNRAQPDLHPCGRFQRLRQLYISGQQRHQQLVSGYRFHRHLGRPARGLFLDHRRGRQLERSHRLEQCGWLGGGARHHRAGILPDVLQQVRHLYRHPGSEQRISAQPTQHRRRGHARRHQQPGLRRQRHLAAAVQSEQHQHGDSQHPGEPDRDDEFRRQQRRIGAYRWLDFRRGRPDQRQCGHAETL